MKTRNRLAKGERDMSEHDLISDEIDSPVDTIEDKESEGKDQSGDDIDAFRSFLVFAEEGLHAPSLSPSPHLLLILCLLLTVDGHHIRRVLIDQTLLLTDHQRSVHTGVGGGCGCTGGDHEGTISHLWREKCWMIVVGDQFRSQRFLH